MCILCLVWPFLWLTSSTSVGHGRFGGGEDRGDVVGIADVEEHTFRKFAGHAARFEVDDEECLPTLEFERIRALFLNTCKDPARVVAERHNQSHELR